MRSILTFSLKTFKQIMSKLFNLILAPVQNFHAFIFILSRLKNENFYFW